MAGALEGIGVLEVAGYLAGPYATMLLGDLGADVIKVEHPDGGDPFRRWDGEGFSPTFASVNRNKRSVALDLRAEADRDVFLRLLEGVDVLVCNLRPSAAGRLGLDYESLAPRSPRLVHCSITGFGELGPSAERPGYDTVGQALGGLLSLVTDPAAPEVPGISLADHLAGAFACQGVLAALLARERTGRGQKVETSLLQATVSFVQEAAARALAAGSPRDRRSRPASAQAYAFTAGDGLPFVVHLSSPEKFWVGLTEAVGRPGLRDDPRFATRRARVVGYEELRSLLAGILAGDTRAAWLERLSQHDVPSAPIRTVDEVLVDPDVRAFGFPVELEHPRGGRVRLTGSPVGLSDTPPSYRLAPPLLGEHTAEVLAELDRKPT
jgi:crotonobetainyl-CoA:carnitine CoA-transferase CaiB-like acyl-CoA transferase